MNIDYSPRAQADLLSIFLYLKGRSPRAATEVVRQIRVRSESLLQFPLMGARTGMAGIRRLEVGRYPYLIFYRVEGDLVSIVHIRHASRRPWRGGED
jgi:addiction module RelE/StbE family toxin